MCHATEETLQPGCKTGNEGLPPLLGKQNARDHWGLVFFLYEFVEHLTELVGGRENREMPSPLENI